MPGGYKNIKPSDRTNGLEKNPQNINRKGQPKKIYTVLKEKGYGAEDIKTAPDLQLKSTMADSISTGDDLRKQVMQDALKLNTSLTPAYPGANADNVSFFLEGGF